MLDLEVVTAPTQVGTDIVSVADLKRHLLITHSRLDADFEDIILDVADKLHGIGGELNRTVFPTTWCRYLSQWPADRKILLPYPPLVEVESIVVEDGESPSTVVDSSLYVVRTGTLVGEVELKTGEVWPTVTTGPRAIAVTFRAGYSTYPPKLKRMIKLLAGHYHENREATINDPRVLQINRQIEFGVGDLRAALRVPVSHDNWGE